MTASNKHDRLKYKAIQIGPALETRKMTVYTKLKACCLDDKGWSWIKVCYAQKVGQQATENFREHYESAVEANKCVARIMANIHNVHFTKQTYIFI